MTSTKQNKMSSKHWLLFWSLLICSAGCFSQNLYEPSRSPAYLPAPNDDFALYLAKNRENIRAALQATHYPAGTERAFQQHYILGKEHGYTLDEAVELRAPFEMHGACAGSEPSKGFLLIHGLTDSPYLLRNIANSLQEKVPCSVIRSVLLPGHGTTPGDSLTMNREQWREVTQYGIAKLQELPAIQEITLVGFSTGTSLAIDYMASATTTKTKIARLVLLSPAVKASSNFAMVSVWARALGFKWLSKNLEMDAARYESFSFNAGAEFYQLTKAMTDKDYPEIKVPVLMAVSGDDSTINPHAAEQFYCEKTPKQGGHLIWYQSVFKDSAPARSDCNGMKVVQIPQSKEVLSFSHLSLSTPESDLHYGRNGKYRQCKEYEAKPDEYRQCVTNDADSVFGESNVPAEALEGRYLRRGTFNPLYEQLVNDIVCFVGEGC